MVREYVQNIIEKNDFKAPISIALPYWLAEEKGTKFTIVMDQIDESTKAIQVKDIYGTKFWLPKSQIEIGNIEDL